MVRYGAEEDFDFIYEIIKKNISNLGYVMPPVIRERISSKMCVVFEDKGFCLFNVLKRTNQITVSEIAVDSDYRGQGIAQQMLDFIREKHPERFIKAKCVKGTTAETFWNHVADKVGEEEGRKRSLCVYIMEPKQQGFI